MTKADDILAGMEASAWRDATMTELPRIILNYQKEDMLCGNDTTKKRAKNYSEPLFTASTVRAALEKMERETLERAAKVADKFWNRGGTSNSLVTEICAAIRTIRTEGGAG